MSHELEMLEDGSASMAYTGETPWHGLGFKVADDLTPEQMLKAANLDWGVYTEPCYVDVNGTRRETNKQALIRDRDHKILDIISDDWKPMQNSAAFEFFNDFVAAGDMKMNTAGSLKGGRIVWALATINESFDLFGGKDRIDTYLHFTNPHSYGQAIDVRVTHIRVVCNNTLQAALNSKSKNVVKVNHCREFDADEVKMTMGIAKDKLQQYHEAAKYLSTKRYSDEDIVDYFKRVFPISANSDKELSRNARLAIEDYVDSQPGSELGEGTFWQLHCAVTYMVDHKIGRSQDTRLASAWYGGGSKKKVDSLDLALEMAG